MDFIRDCNDPHRFVRHYSQVDMIFKSKANYVGFVAIATMLAYGLAQSQSQHSIEDSTTMLHGEPDGVIHHNTFGGIPHSISQYFSDVATSLVGFLIGIILLVLTISVMFKVEHALADYDLIAYRCNQATQFIDDSTEYRPELQSWPVLVHGTTEVVDSVFDKETGFNAGGKTVRLKRVVEIYQWEETKHEEKRGEHTHVHYTYEAKWSETDVHSSNFHRAGEHQNVRREPGIHSMTIDASEVHVGAYELSAKQIDMLEAFIKCDVTQRTDEMNKVLSGKYNIEGNYLLLPGAGQHDNNVSLHHPMIGNMRIKYEAVFDHGPISTVGVLEGHSFRGFSKADAKVDETFQCCAVRDLESAPDLAELGLRDGLSDTHHHGSSNCSDMLGAATLYLDMGMDYLIGYAVKKEILLLEERKIDLDTIFQDSLNYTTCRVSLVRLGALISFIVSANLIFGPIPAVLEFIPFVNIGVDWAVTFFSVIFGIILNLIVFCAAFLFYKPEYMFLCSLGCSVFFFIGGNEHTDTVGALWLIISLVPLAIFIHNYMNQAGYENYVKAKLQELRNSLLSQRGSGGIPIAKDVKFANYSAIPSEDPTAPAFASAVVSTHKSTSEPVHIPVEPTEEPASAPVEPVEEPASASAGPAEGSASAPVEPTEEPASATIEPTVERASSSEGGGRGRRKSKHGGRGGRGGRGRNGK